MAERRMFAKSIIDSDAFLDMPLSAQCLYFHLAMRADDDGFINNPKKIQRMVGASEDDLKLLIAKKFIIVFDTGVVVIKHWRIHNYIQKDRYHETNYIEEKSRLSIKDNGAYTLDTPCIQDGYSLETQVRLGKDSIGKDRLVEVSGLATEENDNGSNEEYADSKFKKLHGKLGKGVVLLTDEHFDVLVDKLGLDAFNHYIEKLADFIIEKDAKVSNHYKTILKWAEEDARCI